MIDVRFEQNSVQGSFTNVYSAVMKFIKIGEVRTILYFGAQIPVNLYPHFPHLLFHFSNILNKRPYIMLSSICVSRKSVQ